MNWGFIAERKIREAMEEGAFDRLEGEGRPLDLEENPFEPRELRMAHRLLRNNGFAPAWMEQRKDLLAEIARATPERIAELNARIRMFNLKAPGDAWRLRELRE